MPSLLALVDQLYGMQLQSICIQPLVDAPVLSRSLVQYSNSFAMLQRLMTQPYADARPLRSMFDQPSELRAGVQSLLEQIYPVAVARLLRPFDQLFSILQTDVLLAALDQPVSILEGTAVVQTPQITVTADGVPIHPYHINIEVSETTYAIKGEIHLADIRQFALCAHLQTVLEITIDADSYTLLVEGPHFSVNGAVAQYIVPAISRTVLLDSPYAETLNGDFGGSMASSIVAGLAATAGITTIWQLVDWYIPQGILYAVDETPMAVIRRIVSAVGGIIQTSPDGELICRHEYPVSVPDWQTAEPAITLTDVDHFFTMSTAPEIRDGYNLFQIADKETGAAGITIDQEEISSSQKIVKIYQVPFVADQDIGLGTSGGAWITIEPMGIVDEQITETVEIIAGQGRATRPIYAINLATYQQAPLGAITPAEDGSITAEIAENSLVKLSYITRYRKFIVTDPLDEDAQFYPIGAE